MTKAISVATAVGDGPAFCAYLSANQAISVTTTTLMQFNTKEFDTTSAFNNTASGTPYSFKPQVAGYYQINCVFQGTNASGYYQSVWMVKNGTQGISGTTNTGTGALGNGSIVSAIVYLNGSTDYLQFYAYTLYGGNIVSGSSYGSYVNGVLMRAA